MIQYNKGHLLLYCGISWSPMWNFLVTYVEFLGHLLFQKNLINKGFFALRNQVSNQVV